MIRPTLIKDPIDGILVDPSLVPPSSCLRRVAITAGHCRVQNLSRVSLFRAGFCIGVTIGLVWIELLKMADTLPDEIISEILSPALKVPEYMFGNLSSKSPFAKYSVSSSVALLVCKAWLRVATPLLYNVVVLRSKGQARALQDALQNNRELGRFIKKLRAEGAFAGTMEAILKSAPNVTDLFLSLQIHSSDSSSGLAAGLGLINPTRLIIYDDQDKPLRNKAVLQLIAALETCLPNWSNLSTIVFPYSDLPQHACHMMFDLIQIAKLPSLEAVEIRTQAKEKFSDPPTSTDSRLKSLLRWADKPKKPAARTYKLTARPPVDPNFRPLYSTPPVVADKIWSRILFFSMLGLDVLPKKASQKKTIERKVTTKRLHFLLVSKLFYRLALPYLYRLPIIPSQFLQRFADTLSATPALGTHVRVLDVSQTGFIVVEPPPSVWADILRHTPYLQRLVGHTVLPWAAMCDCAVLTRFTALRLLTWENASTFSLPALFFHPGEAVPTAALPALEVLTVKSAEVLAAFAQMELPNLRRVFVHVRSHTFAIAAFLRAHGGKIWSLRVNEATVGVDSVLTLCPNISTLCCRVDSADHHDLGDRSLPAGFQHAYLTTLVLSKRAGCRQQIERGALVWINFFSTFATTHLPALREVRVAVCEWPTTEHAIAKSVWVQAAEELWERGIKLTNKKGVEWHPRLKAPARRL
ncbi:hypothetical protein B0H16DRAFT_1739508 [Mycena metata]|uniref:Uncharacterized protein n=1 Tax=Mycena metata TaxID=1033252 RepID=A0AAD7MJA8_9AGAR|nr:hypothetical protein B0H16DRAFT_1739508 [Mycena metata]